MAKKNGGAGGGGVTRPAGQASPAKSGSTRGFVPQGQRGTGRSGSQVNRTGGDLTPGPLKSANKVQGK